MKFKTFFLFLFFFSFFLFGCERVNEGTVVGRDFRPAWTEHTLCYFPGASKYKGKGMWGAFPGDWLPCTNFHPDRWRLQIEHQNRNNEYRRMWITVSQYDYERFELGDWWSR